MKGMGLVYAKETVQDHVPINITCHFRAISKLCIVPISVITPISLAPTSIKTPTTSSSSSNLPLCNKIQLIKV